MKRTKHPNLLVFRLSLALAFLSPLLACSGQDSVAANGPMFGNAEHMDVKERIQLEEQAVLGNAASARRLILHYTYGEEDPYQLEVWLTVAMRDGDENAKTSLGWLLATGEGAFPRTYAVTADSCKRGRTLLEEAKKDGDTAAASMLEKISKDCDYKKGTPAR